MKALLKQNLCQYGKTINAGNPLALVKRFKASFYEINALFCKQ